MPAHANLLPGRLGLHYLHPLLVRELGHDFDLDRVLAHGSLPGIYADADPARRAATLRSYVDAYLREEIQAEALVRDIGGYSRLLDLVAASSGRVINLHALSRDAAVSYETARRYLDVLEDTLVLFRLPAWSGSDRASLVTHPKLLFFDIGVRKAAAPAARSPARRRTRPAPGASGGPRAAPTGGDDMAGGAVRHFRSRRGAEVDFVVTVERELWAVEVKASSRVDARDPKGLEDFSSRAGGKVRRRIVVFMGSRRQQLGAAEAVPLEEFLDELPA